MILLVLEQWSLNFVCCFLWGCTPHTTRWGFVCDERPYQIQTTERKHRCSISIFDFSGLTILNNRILLYESIKRPSIRDCFANALNWFVLHLNTRRSVWLYQANGCIALSLEILSKEEMCWRVESIGIVHVPDERVEFACCYFNTLWWPCFVAYVAHLNYIYYF